MVFDRYSQSRMNTHAKTKPKPKKHTATHRRLNTGATLLLIATQRLTHPHDKDNVHSSLPAGC